MQSISVALPQVALARIPGVPTRTRQVRTAVELRCPQCYEHLATVSYRSLSRRHSDLTCTSCFARLAQEQEIWLALPPERQAHFAKFVREYEHIRREEGRQSNTAEFYLALPYRDLTGCNSQQWAIREKTFRFIVRYILPELLGASDPPLTILDLGAGNGWMSHRLARIGHQPIAVDLLTNSFDGLGAARHYRGELPALFPRFHAELDNLPFADEQFDCAIFNASFHYSENYSRTLTEAIRCLRPGGTILIADSPTYSAEAFGELMRKERQEYFLKRFGFRSDSLASCEYLTQDRLIALEAQHDFEWTTHRIWYGTSWALRPWLAKVKRRREPSQFLLYSAKVKTQ